MKEDISKRKTPFFCISKGLSNKQKKNFMLSASLLVIQPQHLLAS